MNEVKGWMVYRDENGKEIARVRATQRTSGRIDEILHDDPVMLPPGTFSVAFAPDEAPTPPA
jgi:hypothetical protein